MRATARNAVAMLGMLALAGIAGCAGGPASSMREDDEHHRLREQLAVEEARLQEAQDQLDALDPAACPDRCRAATSICDASSRICVIARDLGDAHTMTRCDRSQELCREAHTVTRACGCADAPVDAGTVKSR